MIISEIDPNLIVKSYINKPDVRFFEVSEAPFSIHGVKKSDGCYRRLPTDIAAMLNRRAMVFSKASAGGRVRFVTDSTYIAVRAHITDIYRIPMLTLTASAGFDLYEGSNFIGVLNPPYELQNGGVYEAVIKLGERRERVLTLNMPAYASVIDLEIGIDGEATLSAPPDYTVKSPIIFYGSSITHGACASRAGLAYPSVLSRMLDADIINLGFGAGCRGECALAEYIGSISASVFVCAYDHNAPNKDKLLATHEPFFNTLRSLAPTLPVVLVSRPLTVHDDDTYARYEIIKQTYEHAFNRGDKNVYLISGRDLLYERDCDLTMDGIHPNDRGFYRIAETLASALKDIIK